MAMDRADARRRLWDRYDAGEVTADEVEARLVLLDRAGDDDESAVRAAVEGPLPLRQRAAHRRTFAALAVAVVVLLLVGGAFLAGEDGDGTPTATSGANAASGSEIVVVAGPAPIPLPPGPTFVPGNEVIVGPDPPPPGAPDCETPEVAEVPTDAPVNPSLLSDPPFLPEGYELDDDDDIEPGTDPDVSMSIAAGSPLPEEIRARVLDGDLSVRMRAFRYADGDAAAASGRAAAASGCQYAADPFEVPDRPEIGASVITGVIPTTAFASWRLDDRRFIVAVESDGDDPEDVEEARLLAGAIAAAELDAARNPPAAPAP